MMTRSKDLDDDRPLSLKITALAALLGILALMGLSSAVQLAGWVIVVNDFVWDSSEGRRIMVVFPASVVVGVAALWGLIRLKPWSGNAAPISRTTRRTNRLFYLANFIGIPGVLALFYGTFSRDNPWGFFSNSAISPGIAIIAITSFLLCVAIAWWWYYSADEHDRRAHDFGALAGGGMFVAVTPVWWVAARAGLLPHPDAMVIWCITVGVATIGWFWYRFR